MDLIEWVILLSLHWYIKLTQCVAVLLLLLLFLFSIVQFILISVAIEGQFSLLNPVIWIHHLSKDDFLNLHFLVLLTSLFLSSLSLFTLSLALILIIFFCSFYSSLLFPFQFSYYCFCPTQQVTSPIYCSVPLWSQLYCWERLYLALPWPVRPRDPKGQDERTGQDKAIQV